MAIIQADNHSHSKGHQTGVNDWGQVLRATWSDFADRYSPNVIVTLLALLLLTPIAGAIMTSPKTIVIGIASGLTLVTWFGAYQIIRHLKPPPQEQQAMPDKRPDHGPPSISQSMVNSPSGIQAGRDVNIYQAPKPRHLTDEQRARLLLALRDSQNKGPIVVECFSGVSNSCVFASDLAKVLEAAGWPGRFRQLIGSTSQPPVGLIVRTRNIDKPPAHAASLRHALLSVDLTTESTADTGLDGESVVLVVGSAT